MRISTTKHPIVTSHFVTNALKQGHPRPEGRVLALTSPASIRQYPPSDMVAVAIFQTEVHAEREAVSAGKVIAQEQLGTSLR